MARGKTASPLKLSARKQAAFQLFAQGQSVMEVARELSVAWDTAKRYQTAYEEMIREEALENPELLTDVVGNTFRALVELEQARAQAWDRYRRATTDQARAAFLNLVLKAQSDRAKLYGLLGVKPEYAARVEAVRSQQAKLMEFMNSELCPIDRQRLIEFIQKDMGEQLAELPTAPEPTYSKA